MAGIPRITFFIHVTLYSTSKKTTCYETESRNSPKDRAPRKADYEQQTTDGFSRTENAGVHRYDVSVVADRFLCIPADPLYMGLFHAPHVVGEALKTAQYTAALFSRLGDNDYRQPKKGL